MHEPNCDDNDECTVDLCEPIQEGCGDFVCTYECAESCPNPPAPFYLLLNDVDEFTFSAPDPDGHTLHLVIADPSIAKFRVGQVLQTSLPTLAPPITVDVQGLAEGVTLVAFHLDSPDGPKVACYYLKVGGSIALQFNQLPTYIPYRSVIAGQSFVTKDYQLDNLNDPVLGPLSVPQSTLDALEGIPNAAAAFRVVVRNADGDPMSNKLVVLIQVPETSAPAANLMTIAPSVASTNGQGRMEGNIVLARPDGFLEVDIPHWKLLVLVGRAAENYVANPPATDVVGAFDRNGLALDSRVSNGHLIMWKQDNPTPLAPRIEAAMAVSLPHISNDAFLILKDFFDNALGRVPVTLSDAASFPGEGWRIHDVVGSLQVESDLWIPPAVRSFDLLQYDKPVPFAAALYPNDEVSRLMTALQGSRYDTDGVQPSEDDDLIIPSGPKLQAGSLACEVAIGSIPLIGDGRDIVNEIWDVVQGGEFNYIIFSLSAAGLGADLGSLFAGVGIPANVGLAMIKGLVKEIPQFIVKQYVQNLGGLAKAGRSMGRYILHFSDVFETVSDWLSPAKIKAAYTLISGQLRVVRDSHLVRFGNFTDELVAPFAAKAMEILSDLPRRITNRAADGIVGYARHGEGGAETFKELIDAFPATVRGDCTESVSEAVSKTLRNELVDPPGSGNYDQFGKKRVDEAVEAGLAALQTNDVRQTMRTVIAQDSFVSTVIKDERELEALLRMRGRNLTADQVHAINIIRTAVGMPQIGQRLARVVHLNDPIGGFGAQQLLDGGNPGFAGFFTRAQDIPTTPGISPLIDRLRLDGSQHAYGTNSPYAIIETRANVAIVGKARVPRNNDFATGNNSVDDLIDPFDYPGTGNGFPAYKDGYPAPEWRTQGGTAAAMDAGLDLNGKAITVMRVRDTSGASAHLTNSATQQMASDWKLVELVPGDPSQGYKWDPCVASECN